MARGLVALPVIFSLLAAACVHVPGEKPLTVSSYPPEVGAFIERREGCDHFRGEEPYDAEREAFLLDAMKQTCTGTDAELARLRKKYAGNSDVIPALADFEDTIEFTGDAD